MSIEDYLLCVFVKEAISHSRRLRTETQVRLQSQKWALEPGLVWYLTYLKPKHLSIHLLMNVTQYVQKLQDSYLMDLEVGLFCQKLVPRLKMNFETQLLSTHGQEVLKIQILNIYNCMTWQLSWAELPPLIKIVWWDPEELRNWPWGDNSSQNLWTIRKKWPGRPQMPCQVSIRRCERLCN